MREIQTCSPQELRVKLREGAGMLVDVREYPEYVEAHIEGATLLPLGELRADPSRVPTEREVLLLCRTGRRAREAAAILSQAGHSSIVVVEGGIEAWRQAHLPTRSARGPISLERQVRIAAGGLVLLGLLAPGATFLSYFVGAGLIFAGVSNTCAMGLLLAKLPWNRPRQLPACSTRQ